MTAPKARVYILTGERGVGKSVVCRRLTRLARERGLSVAGLLTERAEKADADSRTVVDLSTNRCFPFGRREDGPGSSEERLMAGWDLHEDVFAAGNAVLERATPCDLLVIDELGPLELDAGKGWTEAFTVLGAGDFVAAVVVCRPALVGLLLERTFELASSRPEVVTPLVVKVDQENREDLPAWLAEEVCQ